MNSDETYRLVQERYGGLAAADRNASGSPSIGSKENYEEQVATAFGYNLEDLRSIPEGANLGVSCGNPLATAGLREGETVVDLGSGGGIDVLLAGSKVGPTGKAIGIDMTKDMLDLARRNAEKSKASNVSFIEASITSVPLPEASVDCIISNCVVNLVPEPEKPTVFHEMFRLLKPGGRVAVSDILARKELPEEVTKDLSLYVGCIAGASQVGAYDKYLKDAGFEGILIVDTNSDLNLYKSALEDPNALGAPTGSCCGAKMPEPCGTSQPSKLSNLDFNEWTGSYKIYAVKPSSSN
ncbi:hypothetical protein FQN54_005981 [Arachnomyces sp. PD_36]|nr:hypothetical protein FQN54_005981 [Arachnomyces sp. PD_36]